MSKNSASEMLANIADRSKLAEHPRAEDLLHCGNDMARALSYILAQLGVLDPRVRGGRVSEPEIAMDAICRLIAQRGWLEALMAQYAHLQADLGGEGYAYLHSDGTPVPYFGDDSAAA